MSEVDVSYCVNQVWEEASTAPIAGGPLDALVTEIMASTHIFPQHYKLNRIRYDPASKVKHRFGNVYKGHDLDICVSAITDPGRVSVRFAHCMSLTGRSVVSVEHC